MRSASIRWIRAIAVISVVVGTGLVTSAAPATAGEPTVSELPVDDPVPGESQAPGQPVVIDLLVDPAPESPSPDSEPATPVEAEADAEAEAEAEATGAEPTEEPDPLVQTGTTEPDAQNHLGDMVEHQLDLESTDAAAVAVVAPPQEVAESDAASHDSESDSHDSDSHDSDSHGSGGHGSDSGNHEGGGQGNPYRMTFAVLWYTADGEPILELLPEWRTWFELAASSQTGSGRATSATCAYAEGSDELTCEFDNRGHSGIDDGMVVPARPTATYTVTVPEFPEAWTSVNANDDPYSARELCPRGSGSGGSHSGGSDDHHDSAAAGLDEEGHTDHEDGSAPGGRAFFCEHVVEMHEVAVVLPPADPPVDDEEGQSPTAPEAPEPPPETVSPVGVVQPTVASAASTPRTLPATGSSVSLMLVVGGLLVAAGAALTATTRVRGTEPNDAGI